jgi:hypothetical protein
MSKPQTLGMDRMAGAGIGSLLVDAVQRRDAGRRGLPARLVHHFLH